MLSLLSFTEPEKATMVQKLTRHADKFHREELEILFFKGLTRKLRILKKAGKLFKLRPN